MQKFCETIYARPGKPNLGVRVASTGRRARSDARPASAPAGRQTIRRPSAARRYGRGQQRAIKIQNPARKRTNLALNSIDRKTQSGRSIAAEAAKCRQSQAPAGGANTPKPDNPGRPANAGLRQQLQAQGQKVALLVLFDTVNPGRLHKTTPSPLIKWILTDSSLRFWQSGPLSLWLRSLLYNQL